MIVSSKAIVLHTLKYGESSLIATCYCEESGRRTYMLKGILKSRSNKLKTGLFQPLTQLHLIANHNDRGKLNTVREARVDVPYQSIHTSLKKQTIAIFIAEFLYNALREEEKNEALYTYLSASLQWLDTHDKTANFHLVFLMNLSKYLGFYPDLKHNDRQYFDMLEARFTNTRTSYSLHGLKFALFKRLLGINFDTLEQADFNGEERSDILQILIQYFELHLSGFKEPRSLSILRSVFS